MVLGVSDMCNGKSLFWICYTKIGKIFDIFKLNFIENKEVESIRTMASSGCPLWFPLCFWLYASPEMPILHWKLFWILRHSLPLYGTGSDSGWNLPWKQCNLVLLYGNPVRLSGKQIRKSEGESDGFSCLLCLTLFFTPIPAVWLIKIPRSPVSDLFLEVNHDDSVPFL